MSITNHQPTFEDEELVQVLCPCRRLATVTQHEFVELTVIRNEKVLCDECIRGGKHYGND